MLLLAKSTLNCLRMSLLTGLPLVGSGEQCISSCNLSKLVSKNCRLVYFCYMQMILECLFDLCFTSCRRARHRDCIPQLHGARCHVLILHDRCHGSCLPEVPVVEEIHDLDPTGKYISLLYLLEARRHASWKINRCFGHTLFYVEYRLLRTFFFKSMKIMRIIITKNRKIRHLKIL